MIVKYLVEVFIENLRRLGRFIGKNNSILLMASLAIGVIMFAAEICFIYSFQLFLSYIGLIQAGSFDAPKWLQVDRSYAMVVFAFFALVRIMLLSLKTLLSSTINQSFLRLQRERIMTIGLLDSPRNSSHEIISMFSDKVSRAGSVLSDGAAFLMSGLTVTSIFFWGMMNAPKEMLTALLLTSSVVLPLKYLDRKIREQGKVIDASWEKANKTLLEGIRHYFYLFYHGFIPQEIKKGKEELCKYELAYKKFYKYSVSKNTLPQVAGVVSLISVSIISKKYFGTNPAILLSFLYLFTRMAQGISELVYLKGCLELNLDSFKHVFRFQNRELDMASGESLETSSSETRNIERIDFEKLGFSYEKEGSRVPVFKDFNLSIKKGTPLIIKGPSGVGKSTLISILLGYNKKFLGNVTIDGKPLSGQLESIRPHVSYVGPEPFLFQDTIYNNLTQGLRNKNADEVMVEAKRLLERMKLWDYVERQDKKFDSTIAEFADLSTGQKQRLSLTRALLRHPTILILDEATANIDKETERIIIDILQERSKDMIVIVITHKDSFDDIGGQMLLMGQ